MEKDQEEKSFENVDSVMFIEFIKNNLEIEDEQEGLDFLKVYNREKYNPLLIEEFFQKVLGC
jgi:hypothetical protein